MWMMCASSCPNDDNDSICCLGYQCLWMMCVSRPNDDNETICCLGYQCLCMMCASSCPNDAINFILLFLCITFRTYEITDTNSNFRYIEH